MLYTLSFFSSKCSLFHNSNVFGSCIIHILYTGCAKVKKKFRRQKVNPCRSQVELDSTALFAAPVQCLAQVHTLFYSVMLCLPWLLLRSN